MINPVFAVTAVLGVLLPLLPSKDARTQRRLYWVGALTASVSAFFALFPPDWGGGLGLAAALAAVLVIRAYMGTSHISIRGRTYAFNRSDSEADDAEGRPPNSGNPDYDQTPDSYAGFATAAKTWWLFAFLMILCAFIVAIFVTQHEGPWYALGAVAVMTTMPLFTGHQDYRGATASPAMAAASEGIDGDRAHPHLRKKFTIVVGSGRDSGDTTTCPSSKPCSTSPSRPSRPSP